jgi:hypothetical protein
MLHVEANEGGSSGGHLAIRLGDDVYHWQNEGDGSLRLSRRDAEDFLYEYAILENRTIHRSRVAVSGEEHARLRGVFQRRWLDEAVAFDGLAVRRADRDLIASLLRASAAGDPEVELRVPAAGLFSPGVAGAAASERSEALAALRARLARDRGREFASTRAVALREEIRARVPAWLDRTATAAAPEAGGEWTPQAGLAGEVADRLAGALALDALAAARGARAAVLRAPSGDAWRLAERERRALEAWADRLEGDLAALAGSARPGWGPALLVGMARLDALRRSLDTGRLVVVDSYPDRPSRVSGARLERYRALLPGVLAEAGDELAAARARFADTAENPSERAWTAVETAANRAIELAGAIAGDDLRIAPAPMTPLPSAPVRFAAPPESVARLERALAAAEEREGAWLREVERRFAYRLLTRNCVTEVFRLLDETLGIEGAPTPFVPFRAAAAVRERWPDADEREIPSLRRRARPPASRIEGVVDALREASPLTSRLAVNARRDSIFLFYADGLPLLRPPLGALNLATGLGAALAGVALAPFDGGDTAVAGLRGVLFSVPELGFIAIRKGSFEWVPPAERPAELALDPLPEPLPCVATGSDRSERAS